MVESEPYLPQSLIAVVDRELMIINTGMMPMITPAPTVRKARVIGERLFIQQQDLLEINQCGLVLYNLYVSIIQLCC